MRVFLLVVLDRELVSSGVAMGEICVNAGKNVYDVIQDGGFDFDKVTTYVGVASGPAWLVASGFDQALLGHGILGNKRPVLLVGASAGALRFAAWMQPEPEKSCRRLIEAYTSMDFTRGHRPEEHLQSLHDLIGYYIDDDAIPFALGNKRYRLAIMTARAKNLAVPDVKWVQMLAIGAGFFFNALNRSLIHKFFQRVVFHNSPIPPPFCLDHDFKGLAIALNHVNFKHALLASVAEPFAITGVKNIYGAPNGTYRDGGLTDYHLNQKYAGAEGTITLMFNNQERLIPAWLDKGLRFRRPAERCQEDLLMVYPSGEFLRKLPYGKAPDRRDYKTYAYNPSGRIRNWRQTVETSKHLGEQFLELVASGRLRDVVKKM
ncbi:MAG: hypothetical protein U9N38_03030 [Thermodesulfobacteriota bacterium]|nr:hypothetical protein [Thermodesulfobacteriota bacterium]